MNQKCIVTFYAQPSSDIIGGAILDAQLGANVYRYIVYHKDSFIRHADILEGLGIIGYQFVPSVFLVQFTLETDGSGGVQNALDGKYMGNGYWMFFTFTPDELTAELDSMAHIIEYQRVS
jgi:hypothetical protein